MAGLFMKYKQEVNMLHKAKKIFDYLYLRSKGVETHYGFCKLIGLPIISKHKESRIIIEEGVTIVSKTKGNIAGVNNRTIIATLDSNAMIIIKKNSGISGAKLIAVKKIELGENCGLGVNTVIYDTDFHPISPSGRKNQKSILDAKSKEVLISTDVLIGANSIILKGSIIRDGVVVGAGSIVSGQELARYSVYAGNPVRKVKDINDD